MRIIKKDASEILTTNHGSSTGGGGAGAGGTFVNWNTFTYIPPIGFLRNCGLFRATQIGGGLANNEICGFIVSS